MLTYDHFTDVIMVTMGYTHDDRLRNREAVMYNVKLAVDKLKAQQLQKSKEIGDYRRNSNLVSTFIVPITHNDVADGVVTDFDASYFDLPTSIYSLNHDGGVSFVRYLRNEIPFGCPPAVAKDPFTGASLASIHTFCLAEYQKPKPQRPYFARAKALTSGGVHKDRVYLFGVSQDVKHLLVGLYAATDFTEIDPDAPIDVPEHLLMPLKQMVIDLERWAIQVPQERLKNDGRDFEPNQIVRTERQMSMNNPIQIDN
jgi:hypothetical protein